MSRPSRSWLSAGAVLLLSLGLTSVPAVAGPTLAATAPVITIADPAASGQPIAGKVEIRGSVGAGPAQSTTVLYVVDATGSTSLPAGDCSGDGSSGAEDDSNGDGVIGDTLDCEISAVRSLNASLIGSSGSVQVGLGAFANEAAAANLSPTGSALFVRPGAPGGAAEPHVVAAATSVTRSQIARYEVKDLGGSGAGTAFNNAVPMALSALAQAPAGPKWVMFVSDGLAPLAGSTLDGLRASGVHWRSFAVGGRASCAPHSALAKMAAATGEACVQVTSPAALAASVTSSQPDNINGVTVSVRGVSVAADLDAIGGWRAPFVLGAGTYTVEATATLASGSTSSSQRTFTVTPPGPDPDPDPDPDPPGPAVPDPGTVATAAGTLRAVQLDVRRPQPSRATLPARVTGRAGRPGRTVLATTRLEGATVLLQSRPRPGAEWTTVARDRVDRAGEYVLRWKPGARKRLLRVRLDAFREFAVAAAAVPTAQISACRVTRKDTRFSMRCETTATAGTPVRLIDQGQVVDRARVAGGKVTVAAAGRPAGHTLVVDVSATKHVRLHL